MKFNQGVAGLVILVVAILAFAGWIYPTYFKMEPEVPDVCVIDADCGAGFECRDGNCIQVIIQKPAKCDMRATQKPELRIAVTNPRNSTATDYQSGTIRVYEIQSDDSEVYKGTLALTPTTGYQSKSSGFATECDKKYAIYLPASDATSVSVRGEVTADENDKTITLSAADQDGPVFRVYDEDNRAYVYASTAVSASSEWKDSGSQFNATTGADDTTIDTNGWYTYTVYIKINDSTVAQYQDQALLLAFDRQSSDDWQKASSITFGEGTNVKVTEMESCPTKISNNGYEDCFDLTEEITVNAKTETIPLKITDSQRSLTITQYSISGVNPDDDIKIALCTSGYFANVLDEGMGMDFYKDDASKTLVFTCQYITFAFG